MASSSTVSAGDIATATQYNNLRIDALADHHSDASGTKVNLTTGVTGLVAGSIPFMGATGLAQDNANLFWDDTNNCLGIGTSSPDTDSRVRIGGTWAGSGGNARGLYTDITVTSAVTTAAFGLHARVRTQAAAFTLSSLYTVYVEAPLGGAGSTITTAYGVYIEEPTAGGTNYALYSAGGTNYLGGVLSIGATPPGYSKLFVGGTYGGDGIFAQGIHADFTVPTGAGYSYAMGVHAKVRTAAAAFTLPNLYVLYAENPTKGAGSTITTAYGVYIESITAGSTNYGLYSAGGLNYFNGNVGIGNTNPQEPLHVGAGVDASDVAATLILATAAGAANIAVRDSTNNVEGQYYVASTGVYTGSYTNHSYSLVSNNIVAITIDTSQQVGIGNAGPQALLHVGAGTDAPQASTVVYATAAGTTIITARDSTNNVEAMLQAASGGVYVGAYTNHSLILRTNNVDRLTISNAGAFTFGGALGVNGQAVTGVATLAFSSTPATTGTIMLGNNQSIKARNAGNTADVALIYLDASNNTQLDAGAGQKVICQKLFQIIDLNGGTGSGTVYYAADGTLTSTAPSSRSYKQDITPWKLDPKRVLSLAVRSFKWRGTGIEDFGLIAEDVAEILPELYKESNGVKGYRKDNLPFYLLEVIKLQEKRIAVLETRFGLN